MDAIEKALEGTRGPKRSSTLRSWATATAAEGHPELLARAYERLLAKDPNDHDALRGHALLLCAAPEPSVRDGEYARVLAERLCEQEKWANWKSVSVLAAAYAETGNFTQAVEYAQLAEELAPAEERPERRRRIEQYRAEVPFRLPPWARRD